LIIQERKHSVSTNNEIDAESGSKTRAKKIDPTPECPEILNYLSLTPEPFCISENDFLFSAIGFHRK